MKSKKRSLIQDLPVGLSLWWLGLCTVSVFNIGLPARLWMKHLKKSPIPNREAYAVQRRQLTLSTPIVLGCAFRSFLLCFVAQWANLLETFAHPAKENRTMTFSKLLFPAFTAALKT
jgi:hypothetical protein